MRIAYVGVSNSMYIFGGEVAGIMAWIALCDREGWIFDVYVDSSCKGRSRYMDSTLIPRLSRSEGRSYIDISSIPMGRIPNEDAVKNFRSCYNFLKSFETKIPDLVIYSNPYLALLAYPYEIHKYIPSYVVTHLTKLLYDVPSVIPKEVIEVYRILCQIPGIELITQCETNVSILRKNFSEKSIVVVPTFLAHTTVSIQKKEGILYLGGGDEVKNPRLAAKVLLLFNTVHPEVPITVISARRGGTVEKLFSEFAKVLIKQTREQVGKIVSGTKLGLHTAHGESFGLAVAEQLVHYPVVLYDAPYKAVFPTCPVFTTVEEGKQRLEQLYYDDCLYETVRDEGCRYIKETYTQDTMREGFREAVRGSTPIHHVRDTTRSQIYRILSLQTEATPIQELYKRLRWGSAVLGMRCMLAHPDIELLHTQEQTYVRLLGSKADIEKEGILF